MSILGYSTAYFLPQYWANTPLYGEKIIPLLDYVLSTDYQYTERLASAFYDIESKYKNTADLPIDKIEAIIEESGYSYVRELLAQDEDSLRLLVYILVLINELKGSKKGVETVLSLLKTKEDDLQLYIIGKPTVLPSKEVEDFSTEDYVSCTNFTVGDGPFELSFRIKTSSSFGVSQCIASSPDYGFYLGIDPFGKLVLKVGQVEVEEGSTLTHRAWQRINGSITGTSSKPLLTNTTYNIKLFFTGTSYGVSVASEGSSFTNYIDVESSTGLSITGGAVFLGVDSSEGTIKDPFLGTMSLTPFNVTANGIIITQWFETFPVGDEDTFTIEADIDASLMSSDFFVKFAKFIERYVYPSLAAFKAKMALKAKLTFLPYVRQKVTYIASNLVDTPNGYEAYEVITENNPDDSYEPFNVRPQTPKLYAWTYNDAHVYTLSSTIYAATKLHNKDMSLYTGRDFSVQAVRISDDEIIYKVFYRTIEANRDANEDVYGGTLYMVKDQEDSD